MDRAAHVFTRVAQVLPTPRPSPAQARQARASPAQPLGVCKPMCTPLAQAQPEPRPSSAGARKPSPTVLGVCKPMCAPLAQAGPKPCPSPAQARQARASPTVRRLHTFGPSRAQALAPPKLGRRAQAHVHTFFFPIRVNPTGKLFGGKKHDKCQS